MTAILSGVTGLALQAATPAAGFALQDATPTILTWTAPNDGNLHRIAVFSSLVVASTETGGEITFNFTDPGGNARTLLFFAAALGGGYHASTGGAVPLLTTVEAGSVCTLAQTALTGGAATLWAEFWAS